MIKVILLLAATLPVMGGAIITADLPMIAKHFAPSVDAQMMAKMMLTVPALFVALFGPVAGWMADRFGRRPVMLLGLLGFSLAGLTGLVLDGPYPLLIGRAVLGLSIACLMTAGTAMIGDYFKGNERQSFIGKQGAAMALGGVVFVPLGGFLADINWRAPFLIYAAPLLILLLGWIYLLPAVRQQGLESASLEAAPVPGGQIGLIYSLAVISMMMFYMIPVQLPFFLMNRMGSTALEIGSVAGFGMMFSAATSMGHKYLLRFLRFPSIQLLSFVLTAVGFTLLQQSYGYVSLLLSMIPIGMGYGLVIPNSNLWIIELVPFHVRGRFLGGLTSAVFFGFFISPFAVWLYPTGWGVYSFSALLLLIAILSLGLILLTRLKGPQAQAS